MKLIIDRQKWYRGNTDGSKLLRSNDGKMCCLGFYARECGLSEEQIADKGNPASVDASAMEWGSGSWLFQSADDDHGILSADCNLLIRTNDCPAESEALREADIQAIFARHGVEVEFIG